MAKKVKHSFLKVIDALGAKKLARNLIMSKMDLGKELEGVELKFANTPNLREQAFYSKVIMIASYARIILTKLE